MTTGITRRRCRALTALVAVGIAGTTVPAAAVAAFAPPFSPTSPFNRLVPPSPPLAANGAGVGASPRSVNYGEFTPAVYTSTRRHPQFVLKLRNQGAWGDNPVHGKRVRIPAGARASADSDGHLTIVVPSEGVVISLYQAERGPRPDGSWWATWAGLASLSGNGGNRMDANGGRESGISQLAGLIHPDDVRRGIAMGPNGDLGHALSVGYNLTHRTRFLPPAITARGTSSSPRALYMGQRIFIDPKLDLDRLPWQGTAANRRFGKLVARTLQRYGAIVVTNAGPLTFQLWHPNSFTRIGRPDPWPTLIGPGYDGWYGFTVKAIPASAFRVLTPGHPGAPTTSRDIRRRVAIVGLTSRGRLSGLVRWQARPAGFAAKRVEFYVNGRRAWTRHTAPYRFGGARGRWDTRSVRNGVHTVRVRAVARDDRAVSRALRVSVRN